MCGGLKLGKMEWTRGGFAGGPVSVVVFERGVIVLILPWRDDVAGLLILVVDHLTCVSLF